VWWRWAVHWQEHWLPVAVYMEAKKIDILDSLSPTSGAEPRDSVVIKNKIFRYKFAVWQPPLHYLIA
jgi:hypothetical protein